MQPNLDSLEVYYTDLSPQRGIIHARLGDKELAQGDSLAGMVRGPRCNRGSTLPATYQLACPRHPQTGPNLQLSHAQALITEPVYWTPDWPALYDVTIDLWQGPQVVAQTTRTIGLRPLATMGKFLTFGGRTWVLRGIERPQVAEADLAHCRESSAALLAPSPLLDERVLTLAAEEGALLIAQIADEPLVPALSRLARSAAVAIVVLPPSAMPGQIRATGNVLLAHRRVQGETEPPADAARLVLAEVNSVATFADWAKRQSRVVIPYRPLVDPTGIREARAECDRLQRDLAPFGQYAGYIVGTHSSPLESPRVRHYDGRT